MGKNPFLWFISLWFASDFLSIHTKSIAKPSWKYYSHRRHVYSIRYMMEYVLNTRKRARRIAEQGKMQANQMNVFVTKINRIPCIQSESSFAFSQPFGWHFLSPFSTLFHTCSSVNDKNIRIKQFNRFDIRFNRNINPFFMNSYAFHDSIFVIRFGWHDWYVGDLK